jgi:UDP-GlcNAc:undecaprenyl-phosphate GlcNAc-1-phosphate transferase
VTQFPFSLYVLAFLGALVASSVSLPLWRRFCQTVGLVDDPGHRKIHDTSIALAGGVAVFTGLLIPLVFGVLAIKFKALDFQSGDSISYGIDRRFPQLVGIFIGAVGMLLLGLADDNWELKPALKFGGQLLVALLVAACGVRITLFVHDLFVSYLLTVLWILTLTNAFNFMDNMNGLCAGVGAIGALCFGIFAAASGQYLVALLAFTTAGSLLGFLPYNFPRASAFLGDSGSHLVGYLLAVLAILPHFFTAHNPKALAVLTPLSILFVPLYDLVTVVVIRWRSGKPFYIGDNNHLSHRLVRRGFSKTKTVLLIWLLACVAGAVSMVLAW